MPYRDDLEALAGRCASLEQRLTALDQRARELSELAGTRQTLTQELERARRQLSEARRGRSLPGLPLLEDLRVASPCSASWDAMTGDERARFCQECGKNVYDLSAMTRAEGERLLQEREGMLCVRFYRRADGTVLTADCPVGVRRRRIRRVLVASVGAGILAAGAAFAGRHTMGAPVQTMGAIAPMVMQGEPLMPVHSGQGELPAAADPEGKSRRE